MRTLFITTSYTFYEHCTGLTNTGQARKTISVISRSKCFEMKADVLWALATAVSTRIVGSRKKSILIPRFFSELISEMGAPTCNRDKKGNWVWERIVFQCTNADYLLHLAACRFFLPVHPLCRCPLKCHGNQSVWKYWLMAEKIALDFRTENSSRIPTLSTSAAQQCTDSFIYCLS